MCDWSRRAPPAASFRLACAPARHPRRGSTRWSLYPFSRHGRARHRPRPNSRRTAPWCHRPARPRRTPARCGRTIPQIPRRAIGPAPSRARRDSATRHRGWSPGTTAHPAARGRRRTSSRSLRTVSSKSRNRSFHRTPGSTEPLPLSPALGATAARTNARSSLACTRRRRCWARPRRSSSAP